VRMILSDDSSSDDDMDVGTQSAASIDTDEAAASRHNASSQEIVVRDYLPPVRRTAALRENRSRSTRFNTRASLANAGSGSSGEGNSVTGVNEIPPLMNDDNVSYGASSEFESKSINSDKVGGFTYL